ncbi:MAG: 3-deoxy-7-phosphoheptulonate synthase [Lachnospiraceae bacterium]|jgi:3-deoxy-7-phosphoheptulonate synthase|nr:3-deoxy-7-phosphoheptulonate synthase [Lachnospiraceae bacterium]
MIVALKPQTTEERKDQLIGWLKGMGVDVHVSVGEYQTILGLVGDTTRLDIDLIGSLDIVDSVNRITEPFKCCNRKFHPDDTVVEVGDAKIGGGHFGMIAGPCSVESEDQIVTIAKAVKEAGAQLLRGGAFKPRTSPYDFQGLKAEGLELLKIARAETGLPIVSEIMSAADLPLFEDVDVLQVGARNMQNFDLLKELGATNKPILLKRGLANSLKELLMSAEYIMASGNEQVILCERGIRTFSDYTRNTLDISAVPMLHELSHLPVIVDPSHATGIARIVPQMAMAATACNADGLIIEVHNDPPHALCDGAQSLRPEEFADLCEKIRAIRKVVAS